MSRYEYLQSKQVEQIGTQMGWGFYSMLMAVMRRADTRNSAYLRAAFPEVWDELQRRYNAPGGYLEGELRPPTLAMDEERDPEFPVR